MPDLNLMMPGHPRYQPKSLKRFFGYDYTYRGLACVEIANLETLASIDVIPKSDIAFLTPEVEEAILGIPASTVDITERKITKHDVRAWVIEAQKLIPHELGRWMHVLLTSYDALDTGRIIQYAQAHRQVILPRVVRLIEVLSDLIVEQAEQLQIGRTHGQHALPITVGFWFSTILGRILYNTSEMERYADGLVGKISGAVGAYNAQVGLGITARCEKGPSFEERVLSHRLVGLKAASISTQILPPEPLGYYLGSLTWMAMVLGQLGRDIRHLMRSEIAEVAEPRSAQQVGSSTMAHKGTNPINSEGLEGDAANTRIEYHRVLDAAISEHQRDLTGSRLARYFPTIPINLTNQLDTLLREDEDGVPFLSRLTINPGNLRANFDKSAHLILSEPLYIAMQMAGYPGDAHKLINDIVAPIAKQTGQNLIEVLKGMPDDTIHDTLDRLEPDVIELMCHPETYVGNASVKAREMVERSKSMLPYLKHKIAIYTG
jgi:adenylosuccinate lyase